MRAEPMILDTRILSVHGAASWTEHITEGSILLLKKPIAPVSLQSIRAAEIFSPAPYMTAWRIASPVVTLLLFLPSGASWPAEDRGQTVSGSAQSSWDSLLHTCSLWGTGAQSYHPRNVQGLLKWSGTSFHHWLWRERVGRLPSNYPVWWCRSDHLVLGSKQCGSPLQKWTRLLKLMAVQHSVAPWLQRTH